MRLFSARLSPRNDCCSFELRKDKYKKGISVRYGQTIEAKFLAGRFRISNCLELDYEQILESRSGDGYWIVSRGGYFNYGCGLKEVEVFENGQWTYSCPDNWKLIDGAVPPLLATFVLVGLAIFCFVRAFRTSRS